MPTDTPLFSMDVERRDAFARGKKVKLPPKCFDILAHLRAQDGKILTRDELLERVWKEKSKKIKDPRTVDQHVARIRRIVRVPVIETVTNFGYKYIGA